MPKGRAKVIQDLLNEVHEEERKLREEAEARFKQFMKENGLTLFDFLIGYEVKTENHYEPSIFDDFDLDLNQYKFAITLKTHIRKRTPEEREALLLSLSPIFVCDCGHPWDVHDHYSVKNCVEPECSCQIFTHEKVETNENPDHGE